jgi:hypothetical protein
MTIFRGLKATFAAAILMIGHSGAMAQESPQAAFQSAVAALDQRLGAAETGPLIETTDAAANAADIAAIERAMDSFGSPAFPVDGFTSFETVCEPLNRLSVRHALDGAAAIGRPADAPPPGPAELQVLTAKMRVLQLQNAARHEEAITILSGSGLLCTVKHFPVLAEHLSSLPPAEITPIRLNGARQMRLGIARSLLGYMVALREPATSPANKVRLRAYIADLAAPLAAALTPELRAELTTALDQLPPTLDPETLAATEFVKLAMAITDCVELCLYQ